MCYKMELVLLRLGIQGSTDQGTQVLWDSWCDSGYDHIENIKLQM